MALLVDSIKEYVFYRFNKINMIIKEKYYFDPIKFKNVNIDDERLLMNCEIKKIMKKHNEDNYYKKLYIELMFKNVKKFNNNLKYFLYRLDCNGDRNMIDTTYCNICRCGYLLIAKYILKFKSQKWGRRFTVTTYSLVCACFGRQIETIKWLLTDNTVTFRLDSLSIRFCIYAIGSIKIHKLVSEKTKCLENIEKFLEYLDYFERGHGNIRNEHYIDPPFVEDKSIFDNYKYFKWVMKKIIKENKIYDSYFYIIYEYALKFCKNIKCLKWLTSEFCTCIEKNKFSGIDTLMFGIPTFTEKLNDMDEINKDYPKDLLRLRCIFQTLNIYLNNQNKYNILCKNKNWGNTIAKNNNSDEDNLIILLIKSIIYCNSYNIKFIIKLCNNYHQEITTQQYKDIVEYLKYNTNKNNVIKIIKLLIKKLNFDVKILFSAAFNESVNYICLWLYKKYNLSQNFITNFFYKEIWGFNSNSCSDILIVGKGKDVKINVDRKKIMEIFNEKFKNGEKINYNAIPHLFTSGLINFSDIVKILYKKIEIEGSNRWGTRDLLEIEWVKSITDLPNHLTIKEKRLLSFLRYRHFCNVDGINYS